MKKLGRYNFVSFITFRWPGSRLKFVCVCVLECNLLPLGLLNVLLRTGRVIARLLAQENSIWTKTTVKANLDGLLPRATVGDRGQRSVCALKD